MIISSIYIYFSRSFAVVSAIRSRQSSSTQKSPLRQPRRTPYVCVRWMGSTGHGWHQGGDSREGMEMYKHHRLLESWWVPFSNDQSVLDVLKIGILPDCLGLCRGFVVRYPSSFAGLHLVKEFITWILSSTLRTPPLGLIFTVLQSPVHIALVM